MADPITTFVSKAPTYMGLLMKDFGFDKLDAAAVMGNLGHESNGLTAFQEVSPIGGGRGGFGWAQWTGARRDAFEAYCKRNGKNPKSDDANYGWLFVELKGPESGAVPKTKSAVGLEAKVKAFEQSFERAHKDYKHYDSRVKWAQRALAAYEADDNASDEIPPAPENPTIASLIQKIKEISGAQKVSIVLE